MLFLSRNNNWARKKSTQFWIINASVLSSFKCAIVIRYYSMSTWILKRQSNESHSQCCGVHEWCALDVWEAGLQLAIAALNVWGFTQILIEFRFGGFSFWSTGWQYRWFTVDAQTGILRYFLPTNNWSSSSVNNIASDTHSISSGNRSFDLDALSTSSAFNSDCPSSNHIGSTPRWQVWCNFVSHIHTHTHTLLRRPFQVRPAFSVGIFTHSQKTKFKHTN